MALPSNVSLPTVSSGNVRDDLILQIVTQLNLCVDAVRAIAAKIDADAGTGMDTDYATTVVHSGGTGAPAKIA